LGTVFLLVSIIKSGWMISKQMNLPMKTGLIVAGTSLQNFTMF
jgi:hypothetical protein